MNRCPICRGRVDEISSRCTRCDMNLSYLIQIEKDCRYYCYWAIQCMLEDEQEKARACAALALNLMSTPFTRALSQFVQY